MNLMRGISLSAKVPPHLSFLGERWHASRHSSSLGLWQQAIQPSHLRGQPGQDLPPLAQEVLAGTFYYTGRPNPVQPTIRVVEMPSPGNKRRREAHQLHAYKRLADHRSQTAAAPGTPRSELPPYLPALSRKKVRKHFPTFSHDPTTSRQT
jgi:hypothetical protein